MEGCLQQSGGECENRGSPPPQPFPLFGQGYRINRFPVMAGLATAIHAGRSSSVFGRFPVFREEHVDARHKAGHDDFFKRDHPALAGRVGVGVQRLAGSGG
jgi:hypothetical protein